MSRISNTLKSNQDDQLADYTDGVMEGQIPQDASTTDRELLLLEETILHLSKTYPPITLDEARIKQMHVRLKVRIKREEQKKENSLWRQWLEVLQSNPQMGMVAGVMSILLIFMILSPSLLTAGSSTTATALTPSYGPWAVAGLAGVILFIVWIKRRK